MLSPINVTNLEEGLDGLLVSLVTKKAFDTVEHSYKSKKENDKKNEATDINATIKNKNKKPNIK